MALANDNQFSRYQSRTGQLYDDYYDYDYGSYSGDKTEKVMPKEHRSEDNPMIHDDVLGYYKKTSTPESSAGYKYYSKTAKPDVRASPSKNVERRADQKSLSDNLERFIPSSIKTIIADGGKKIVKTMLRPTQQTLAYNKKKISNPYRTYISTFAPVFAPTGVTTFLTQQWFSITAVTTAWIFAGSIYTALGGTDTGRSAPEPWESLIPDSKTVVKILREVADATDRYHDEL